MSPGPEQGRWDSRRIRLRQTAGRTLRVIRSFQRLRQTIEVARGDGPEDPIIVEWAHSGLVGQNWGDKLNPVLVELVGGRKAVPRAEVLNIAGRSVHYVIGSGLGGVVDPRAVIWGTGFLRYDQVPKVRPRKIAALRGPLSREKYVKAGIQCGTHFGDPALLYPRFFDPPRTNEYQLGLIAHYREEDLPVFARLAEVPGVRRISILGGLEEVVTEAVRCEVLASSSLHGLILADAYGIPSAWLRASELPRGDHFKFHDYLQSVGRPQRDPVRLTDETTVQEILDAANEPTIELDLDELLRVCPFREES